MVARYPLIRESDLHVIWSRQLHVAPEMMTEDSRRLVVEFPGVPSVAGPDFRSARLKIDGRPVVGDVELHLEPSGWNEHGHRSNLEFAGVVLHVSLRRGEDRPVGCDGRAVPELILEPFLQRSLVEIACALDELPPPIDPSPGIARLLDAEGDARLRLKAEHIDRLLKMVEPQELRYRELMGSFGFRQNRAQFEELAVRLPFRRTAGRDEAWIGKALRWKAGLAEERPPELDGPRMRAGEWRVRGVRPANHPLARIDGAAKLLAAVQPSGLLESLWNLVLEGLSSDPLLIRRGAGRLATMLRRWSGDRLGAARASEIAHNVVAPFFLAVFRAQTAYEAARTMRDWWRFSPAPPDSLATRTIKRIIFGGDGSQDRGIVANVRRHQGLLGWYARMMR